MDAQTPDEGIDVDRIAYLARLGLSADEKARLRHEFAPILGYFQTLQELDTDAIPPTAQVIDLANVMRQDTVRASFPTEEVLANAPNRENAFVRVRAVFGDDSATNDPAF